ncbi:MAG: hypothetical protein M3041_09965 [Acidobacteriota bacterium]|nr:hypothetical protein [Acidobacteriota bacterium]
MKKALVLALSVVGFILIAAPTAVERAPLFINGKQVGEALLINNTLVVSVETAAKAGGASLTLQPSFSRQGPRFLAVREAATTAKKAEVPAVQGGMLKQDVGGFKFTPAPGQVFRVQRSGEISSHVFDHEGKAYFPLADLARALGNNTFTGKITPGAAIQLNFSTNPNAILIGL